MVQNNKQRFLAPSTVRSSVRTSHILRWWCACIIRLQQNKQQRAMAKSWWANAKAQKQDRASFDACWAQSPQQRRDFLTFFFFVALFVTYLLALGRNCKQTVLSFDTNRKKRKKKQKQKQNRLRCLLTCERNSVIISKFPLNHLHWSTVFEFYYLNNRVLLSE